ncbi:hypothetical protein [Propionicimonas sp.]|uniref:hypothetical protein n=1 Tax=Propionicimonas sp. TaxID=1955623 RepID=UPI0039E2F4F5
MPLIRPEWTPDVPLKRSEVAVLDCLEVHAVDGLVAMGARQLMDKAGIGAPSGARQALAMLSQRGAIHCERPGTSGRREPHLWRVLIGVDELAAKVGVTRHVHL